MVNTIGNKIRNKAIHKNCQDVVNAIVKTHHKILQNLTKMKCYRLGTTRLLRIFQATVYQIMK